MKQIFRLALPSIISNITVPLLGLVDLAIVGHMGNIVYIGAIAVGTMIFNVIYWLFGFLRMGTSGMTSQAFGQNDMAEVMRLLLRSLMIAMGIALLLLVFQIPLRWLTLAIIHPSAQILHEVSVYFSICIWGAPAILGMYGLTGWFIGMQNTRWPMYVAIFQNIVNIVMSLTLVYGFGMKIAGVGFGTLVAQWAGFLLALYGWHHRYRYLKSYDWKTNLFHRLAMRRFFVVNRDIFIRTLFLVGVNLFFISAGASQGDVILSVNTLLMTFFTIFSYVMDGFAYAGEALSGKLYGAGQQEEFNRVYHGLFVWAGFMVLAFTVVYAVGGNGLLSILTNEQRVINASQAYFWWALLIPVISVAAFIYDGIFIGITATRGMLVSSVISALVFFTLYLLLRNTLYNHALWLSFLVYLGLRGIIQWRLFAKMKLNLFATK